MRLELPTFQQWSCRRCTKCCRDHRIELTSEEHRRLRGLKWEPSDGLPKDKPFFVPSNPSSGESRWRLTHQADGACVFLGPDGWCRIHRKFGAEAKPRACRIFPFAFHPAGKKVAVSLRFSCPSVVANEGEALARQVEAVRELAALALPADAARTEPPPVLDTETVSWPDFLRYVKCLDAFLASSGQPLALRIIQALSWLALIERGRFDRLVGDSADDILQPLAQAVRKKTAGNLEGFPPPGWMGGMFFRLIVAQYSRKDLPSDLESPARYRWRLFRAAIAFTWGIGKAPPLQAAFKAVPFEEIERPFGGIPAEGEERLVRYFRVKTLGLHFCGSACYGLPLAEGFRQLAILYPVILWLARWLAVGEGRRGLSVEDVSRAISIADHNHSHSPAMATAGYRRQVRLLVQRGDLERFCAEMMR